MYHKDLFLQLVLCFFFIYVNGITSLKFVSQHNLYLYIDDMLLLHPLNSPADITDLNQKLNDIHT